MADAPKTPAKGKGRKSSLPLMLGLGAGALVVGYIYLKNKNAAAAAAGATSGGGSLPTVLTTTGGATGPSTLAQWIQDALSSGSSGTYSSTQLLNDINSWLGGSCVSVEGYNVIGGLVSSQGIPPGYSTTPSLTVCPTAKAPAPQPAAPKPAAPKPAGNTSPSAGAPNLSAKLVAAMTNNGEHVVSTAFDSVTNTWVYLTNKGGIYTQAASGGGTGSFYGSYLGTKAASPGTNPAILDDFSSGILHINADGSYSITDTTGHTYTYGKNTPVSAGGTAK